MNEVEQPRIGLSTAELRALYTYVPQWHAVALGPVIPFSASRTIISVDAIFTKTREEAEAALWDHVKAACAREGAMFSEDEWLVTHCRIVGGS